MGHFQTTRWSLVLAAGGTVDEDSREALSSLFEGYWYPVYAFVRSKGYREEDASDIVQSYFASLIERRDLDKVRPEYGRFRSFLLVSIRNFMANEREARNALKRGGNRVIESLDTLVAEERLSKEPGTPADADTAFERRWAMTVVQRARDRMRAEFEAAGQSDRYEALEGLLTGESDAAPYRDLAKRFDLTEAGREVARPAHAAPFRCAAAGGSVGDRRQ